MLASTIQFTTNPPTPGSHHPHKAAEHGPGNQGALPQNPDSMPPPHTQGHPPPPNRAAAGVFPTPSTRQANHPAHQCTTVGRPALPQGQAPQPAQTHQQSEHDQNSQEATPTINP